MSATKINYETLFNGLLKLEEDAREITGDKKERIEAFAKQYGVNKQSVALNFKLWKLKQKDEAEYHEVTGDTDAFLNVLEGDAE
jgi:hypothetical protein